MQCGVSLHRSWHPAGNTTRTTGDLQECILLSKASNYDVCCVLLPGACCSAFDYSAAEALTGFKTKLLQRKGLPADTDLPVVPVSIAA
jgi:hypothetical protein